MPAGPRSGAGLVDGWWVVNTGYLANARALDIRGKQHKATALVNSISGVVGGIDDIGACLGR